MNVYLNLLPEEKREEIKKRRLFRFILGQEFRLAFVIVIVAITLFSISMILDISINSNNGDNLPEGSLKELKAYEDQFKEVNSKISLISGIRKSKIEWSRLLERFQKIMPTDVEISSLSTTGYAVAIVGKARLREGFLELENKLKSSDCFTGISYPPSNIVNKENINFLINFEVKEGCIRLNNK